MKKTLLTTAAIAGFSVGAFAQGSLVLTDGNINPGVSDGVLSASTTDWYSGSLTLQVWYLAGTDTADINAINAYNGVNAAAGYALLTTDDFADEATVTVTVNNGVFTLAGSNLALPNVPTSTTGTFALVGYTGSTTLGGDASVIAFANSTGGNPGATPIPGTPANLTGWNTYGDNMALAAVPEPGTMALSALGGLSLFFFRRKK